MSGVNTLTTYGQVSHEAASSITGLSATFFERHKAFQVTEFLLSLMQNGGRFESNELEMVTSLLGFLFQVERDLDWGCNSHENEKEVAGASN